MKIDPDITTVQAMVRLYCKHHHSSDTLCKDCAALLDYVHDRLANCPLKPDKPTCQKCHIHCYSAEMRKSIKEVMKYAGWRMMIHHPLLALSHLPYIRYLKLRKRQSYY